MPVGDAPELMADDVRALFDRCNNWGKWGKDDQRGALNYMTPETVRRARLLITEGITVGCALPLATEPSPNNPRPVVHLMQSAGDLEDDAQDYVAIAFHGFANTHIDALCHVFFDGQLYNGYPKSNVTSRGAISHSIAVAADGIAGRGVLLDIPRVRGVDWLEPGHPILVEELEAAESAAGLSVGKGDVLMVRTGRHARDRAGQPQEIVPIAGLHASTLPWLHSRQIAVLVGDGVNDVLPSGVSDYRPPIHGVGIPGIGLHLIDNADLEALGGTCADLNRWEFFLVIAPWILKQGTGSPVNPIAIF